MNFLKGILSIRHSFRNTCQPGRINGFDRCFQVVELCTARRDRVTPVLVKTQILKFYQPHMGKQRPFMGITEPRLGIIEPHWGIIEPLLGITKPAKGINKPNLGDFVISSAASEAKTSIIARTSAKAVDSLYAQIRLRTSNHLDSYYLKITFSEPSLDIRTSSFVYNYYVRKNSSKTFRTMMNVPVALPPSCEKKFRGHSIVKQVKRSRDREPSRLPKKILRSMKKRKIRCKLKCILRKYTPKSSRLYGLVTHYKLWYVTYLHKCECFFSNFSKLKRLTASKLLQNNKRITSPCLNNRQKTKSTSNTKRYCVSRMNLLTSGDIELNPGPEQNSNSQTILSEGSAMLLNLRLHRLGLRPVDVGGDGDCFFRAVSHQLYGDPNHHLLIRQAGVQFLSNNPERFIESSTENSWNEYIKNMSMQGTWCDALIVQAIADCQNVLIHIIESHENFAGETLIQPHYLSQHPPTTIYLGHLDELHYVSTAAVTCGSDASENRHSTYFRSTEQDVLFEQPQNSSPKRKRDAYMRKYRKRVKTSESLKGELTSCEKNQNTECQSEYNKGMNTSEANTKKIENLISKFHDIVSHGPLYVCSCCDQLWYKHSVSPADKLTNSNAAAERYLHRKKKCQQPGVVV